MEDEITRLIRSSFVSYFIRKQRCPVFEKTPGVLPLERAMKQYEIAYKRYHTAKKKGLLP
jgi:hypothetical protein